MLATAKSTLNMKRALLLFLTVVYSSFACPREPSPYHSRVAKLPGDNGFKIKINENPQGYVPGKVYTGKYTQ